MEHSWLAGQLLSLASNRQLLVYCFKLFDISAKGASGSFGEATAENYR